MKTKDYLFHKFKIIFVLVIFFIMSVCIYVLYGMNISKEEELKVAKEDLSTALRLLYKYQTSIDESGGTESILMR